MKAVRNTEREGKEAPDNFLGIDQLKLPSCAVIITHYNLAKHLKDAVKSVVDQTYQNWECLIVDDVSDDEEYEVAKKIVAEISHPKVRLIRNQENLGQTLAGFEGLRHTDSQFVNFLDPDDRLLPDFLEEMITMHLNPVIVAPYVCANQYLVEENKGVIASLVRSSLLIKRSGNDVEAIWESPSSGHQLYYIDPTNPGWNRTAHSSMVYRRSALNFCVPERSLSMRNNADAFMSWGCHFLGGTLFYDKPLVVRQLTGENDFISGEIFSSLQIPKSLAETRKKRLKEDSFIALLDNNADIFYKEKYFKNIIARYKNLDIDYIISKNPNIKQYIRDSIMNKKSKNNIIYKIYCKIFGKKNT